MSEIKTNISRFMLAATGSNCGKTTITCAILKALQNRGLKLSSFKCGPDYIDPMFHSKVLATKSKNLDIFMCGEDNVKYLFAENSKGTDIAVIEGVMGLYDGLKMDDDAFSSNHVSLLTDTPTILIVAPKGMGFSLLAEISGFLNFKRNNIKGIILNKVSDAMYKVFKEVIEKNFNIKVYGYMPVVNEAVFPSRHLGLVTAEEISDIKKRLDILAEVCEKSIDLDGLLKLSKEIPIKYKNVFIEKYLQEQDVCIAVALDKAFCFYYEDNFTLLKKMGAKLVFFSPLEDYSLPDNIDGLIIGGGYPEEYAKILAQNSSMKKSIYEKIVKEKIPVLAECGGFMYLCKEIADMTGQKHEMVGVIDSQCDMTGKLTRFGYATLRAKEDNILCVAGESINAHEFHYSDSSDNGCSFVSEKKNGNKWDCIHAYDNIFAGYPHLHLWGNIQFAYNFIEKCKESRGNFEG